MAMMMKEIELARTREYLKQQEKNRIETTADGIFEATREKIE